MALDPRDVKNTGTTERGDKLLDTVLRSDFDAAIREAFCDGARWWEFESTGATMWNGDQQKAYAAADARYKKQ
jgi:hypothetical protein